MTNWRLRFYSPDLSSVIRRLPRRIRLEVLEAIQDLQRDPFPADAQPLARELTGIYRIRIDGWRLIYSVNEDDRIVFIRDVRQRNANTYLNL